MGFLAIQLISPHGALTLLGATNEDLNIISSKMKIQFRAGIKKKKKKRHSLPRSPSWVCLAHKVPAHYAEQHYPLLRTGKPSQSATAIHYAAWSLTLPLIPKALSLDGETH